MNAHLIFRSIVIDHLNDRVANKDNRVVYIYFDYVARQSQTTECITACLLRQVLEQSDEIPAEIESYYTTFMHTNKRPDAQTFIRLLISASQTARTYVVFDAIDECSDEFQEEIFSLLANLHSSKFRLLVSTRPHLQLQVQLGEPRVLEIVADQADMKNYITIQLKKGKNKSRMLEESCLKLAEGVKGQ